MNRGSTRKRSLTEGLITAFSVASVFIILGLVLGFTPDILQKTNAFLSDLTTVPYSLGASSTVNLPAPANPAIYTGFFTAVMYFMLSVGILQIVILPVRLWIKSPMRRIAETVGSLIFWLGGAVVANVFLLAGTLNGWFQFWAGLLLLFGISLIARFTIHVIANSFRNKT